MPQEKTMKLPNVDDNYSVCNWKYNFFCKENKMWNDVVYPMS